MPSDPPAGPSLRAAMYPLLGASAAMKVARDDSRARRCLLSLCTLYAESSSLDTVSKREGAVERLRNLSAEAAPLSGGQFAPLSKLIAGGTDSHLENAAEASARGISAALQIGALLLAPVISPPAALALGIAGVLAEPTLRYLAEANVDLTGVGLVPRTDSSHLRALTQAVFQGAYEAYDKDAAFRELVNLASAKEAIQIDLGAPTADAIASLPPNLRKAVAPALTASTPPPGDSQEAKAAVIALANAIDDELKTLRKRQEEFERTIAADLSERERVRRIERMKQELEFRHAELRGAIMVATVVIGDFLGEANMARALGTIAGAIQQTYKAMELLDLQQIGSLAFAGTMFSAASSLIGLGNTPPEQQLMEALRVIDAKLDALRKQTDRIERRQVQLLDLVARVYREIQQSAAHTVGLLHDLRTALDNFSRDSFALDRERDDNLLGAAIDQMRSLLRMPESARDTIWHRDYRSLLTNFYSYATRTAKSLAYTSANGSRNQPGELARAVIEQVRADLVINLVPVACALVGADLPAEAHVRVPNPYAWAYATRAYLESRCCAIHTHSQDDADWIPSLWDEGIKLKALISTAGTYDVLRKAVERLKAAIGTVRIDGEASLTLIDLVKKIARDHEAATRVKPYQIIQTRSRLEVNVTIYSIGDQRTYPWRVDDDPLDFAVAQKLIRKEEFWSDKNGLSEGHGYRLVINAGAQAGKDLIPGATGLFEYINTAPNGTVIARLWNPPGPRQEVSVPPDALFQACARLIREQVEFPRVVAGLGTAVERGLEARAFESLKDLMAATRMLATLAAWRQHKAPAPLAALNILDFGGTLSLQGTIEFVHMYCTRDLRAEMPSWTDALVAALGKRFEEDLQQLLNMAGGGSEDESSFIVDETLRQLAGYMHSQNIHFKLPQRTMSNTARSEPTG